MERTLLCVLGFFSLNILLHCGHAQDFLLTTEPNWSILFTGESVTFICDMREREDTNWYYTIWKAGQEVIPFNTNKNHTLQPLATGDSGEYQCIVRHKVSTQFRRESNKVSLTVSNRPQPVLTVSPSWLSPANSITLSCSVKDPSAGWRFYWYKAVPKRPDYYYNYELLPSNINGTEQDSYIVHGQTHTAGYMCRAGRGDPVYYTHYSETKFVWSADFHSAASLTVSPDRVQHFTSQSLSLSCEGNSTKWRVRRFSKYGSLTDCSSWGTMTGSTCNIIDGVYWCESESGKFSNAVNITGQHGDVILVSPAQPVAEGDSVTLGCKLRTENVLSNVDFYKNGKLIQNNNRRELTIPAVSKSDEGFYKCKGKDSLKVWRSWTSTESWMSVKTVSGPESSPFPVLLIVGLVCGVLLIILLLLFLYRYRKSKDSCFIRSQSTNQGSAADHMINESQHEDASPLHGDACLYETIKGPEEPEHDVSSDVTYSLIELKNIAKKGTNNEPVESSVYSDVKIGSAADDYLMHAQVHSRNKDKKDKGKSTPAATDETVYSEVKPGTSLGL